MSPPAGNPVRLWPFFLRGRLGRSLGRAGDGGRTPSVRAARYH